MSSECSGISYALRLNQGTIEVRPRFLQHRIVTFEIRRIKSIELLRKSVIPPAVIGGIALSVDVINNLDDGLTWFIPSGFQTQIHLIALGTATVCLIILALRSFFANLVLKPIDTPPITVRMIPTGSARHFVMLVQAQAPAPHDG
jgi:hypothetical protein